LGEKRRNQLKVDASDGIKIRIVEDWCVEVRVKVKRFGVKSKDRALASST
jgi:hypothetical protein